MFSWNLATEVTDEVFDRLVWMPVMVYLGLRLEGRSIGLDILVSRFEMVVWDITFRWIHNFKLCLRKRLFKRSSTCTLSLGQEKSEVGKVEF